MKRNYVKKLGSIMLAVALGLQLAGCTKVTNQETEELKDTAIQELSEENSSGMGRYVEKVTELSDTKASYGGFEIVERPDGSLLLLSYFGGTYESKDNGSTWENVEVADYNNLAAKNYIMTLGVAPDGTIAASYDPYSEKEITMMQGLEVEEEEEQEQEDDEMHPQCMLILPDGTHREINLKLSEDELYVRSFCFDEDGRLFASVFGGNIYEIDTQTGESKLFLTAESFISNIKVQNQILACVSYNELSLYDMEKEVWIEDEALKNFITENCTFENNGAGYDGFFFMGEENAIYIACEKGLYRHILGGSAMEQVIDGSLSTLGNPTCKIMDFVELENQEFLGLYSGARIVHYVYDEDIPTVPSDKLSVYSLRESSSVKQAIMSYQTANPDMYVEYEIGLEENGVTREDALKKLNTKLMEGSGPDVILLDDLPLESYVEKGVLLNISDMVEELNQSEGLYMNLIEPFYTEDSLFAVPSEFKLPILAGDADLVKQADDYEKIADAMETLRDRNPEGKLIYTCSPRGVMKFFSMICEPAWKDEKGVIAEEKVREFLLQSKRIYDAQIQGITQKEIDDYNENNENNIEWEGVTHEDSQYFTMPDNVGYIAGRTRIICGEIGDTYGITDVFSLKRVEELEETDTNVMNGQGRNTYRPINLLGINAAASNQEKALSFIRTMLSATQQEQVYQGFPVNKTALETMLVGNPDLIASDGAYSYWAHSDADGTYIEGTTYWFTEEEKELLRSWITQAATPFLKDEILEEAVFSEGTKYMNGEQDIDTAVQNIVQNAAIYMTE